MTSKIKKPLLDNDNGEEHKNYNLDSAFQHVGGFGPFQFLATISITIMRNSGMYMYYCFGFLTLEQTYLCKNTETGLESKCYAD